jgi:hypothetical protein
MAKVKPKSSKVTDAAPASAAEMSNHYGNVEDQICDLVLAADISATLLEGLLKGGRLESGSNSIYLPDQFQERLIFAAYEVEKRARALKDFMLAGGL